MPALMRRWSYAGLAAGFMIGPSSCAATVNTYTSSATFPSGITGAQTLGFNQPYGSISALASLLAVITVGADASGRIHSNNLCGTCVGSVDCVKPARLTFLKPGYAIGSSDRDFYAFEESVVTSSFSSADASQSFVFDLAGARVKIIDDAIVPWYPSPKTVCCSWVA